MPDFTLPGAFRTEMEYLRHLVYEGARRFYPGNGPERVDPGNKVWHTKNTPKVIGGVTPACARAGEVLYSRVFDHIVPVAKGGTSLVVENVQLLCARHNLQKSDRIV